MGKGQPWLPALWVLSDGPHLGIVKNKGINEFQLNTVDPKLLYAIQTIPKVFLSKLGVN